MKANQKFGSSQAANPSDHTPTLPPWVSDLEISLAAKEKLYEASQRIRGPQGFMAFGNRILIEDERCELGVSMEDAFGQGYLAEISMDLRGFSLERSIIEIAHELNFLTEQDRRWLFRELGEPLEIKAVGPRPEWNAATGELQYRGKLVHRFRPNATRMRPILDAFQRNDWPHHIENPFDRPDHIDPQVVYDAVNGLNDNCDEIQFHVSEGNIYWERRNPLVNL